MPTIRPVTRADFEQWLPLWEDYNAFYERTGPTAVSAEVTQMTWARFFDGYEPMHALVAESNGAWGLAKIDVDLMIGLYAEAPPKGFAFSDTAFRVFVLMASRRLKSDRFYTYDFRPEVYSAEGLAWIADNTMGSVILRHYPALASALEGNVNGFAPWKVAGSG